MKKASYSALVLVIASGVLDSAFGLTPMQSATPSPTPTAVVCELAPVPSSGPPGTRIQLAGTCNRILYHRTVFIFFDATLVASFDAPGPDYSVSFIVPYRAKPGVHVLTLQNGLIGFGELGEPFDVTGEPLPCSGDCNLDHRVEVDELVTGVGIALGARMAETCPPFDVDSNDAVVVNELVMAVDAAMRGCDPEDTCRDSNDCTNGARCLAPDEVQGCGFCRRFDSECEGDVDCPDAICAPVKAEQCPCETVNVCQPRCHADADCEEGEACRESGHCVPQRCTRQECPPLFACRPGNGVSSTCARRECGQDWHCDSGYCINGMCHAALGTCVLPPP